MSELVDMDKMVDDEFADYFTVTVTMGNPAGSDYEGKLWGRFDAGVVQLWGSEQDREDGYGGAAVGRYDVMFLADAVRLAAWVAMDVANGDITV